MKDRNGKEYIVVEHPQKCNDDGKLMPVQVTIYRDPVGPVHAGCVRTRATTQLWCGTGARLRGANATNETGGTESRV